MGRKFPCDGYDLQSHFNPFYPSAPLSGNDSSGLNRSTDGTEYALMGLNNGIAFIDISDPVNPIYLGKLLTHSDPSFWRGRKVYNNYAFCSEWSQQPWHAGIWPNPLRNVASPPETFTEDAYYGGFGHCHNIAINEDTGYAYAIGTSTLWWWSSFYWHFWPLESRSSWGILEVTTPTMLKLLPTTVPIPTTRAMKSFGSNEDRVVIVDVTNKANPQLIKTINYANVSYTHQCWLTDDRNYLLVGMSWTSLIWIQYPNLGFDVKVI